MMMNKTQRGAIAACGVIAFSLTLTAASQITFATEVKPTGHQILIPEDYPYPFNANHGDTIIEIMVPRILDGKRPQERCDDHGGRYATNNYSGLAYCVDVDF